MSDVRRTIILSVAFIFLLLILGYFFLPQQRNKVLSTIFTTFQKLTGRNEAYVEPVAPFSGGSEVIQNAEFTFDGRALQVIAEKMGYTEKTVRLLAVENPKPTDFAITQNDDKGNMFVGSKVVRANNAIYLSYYISDEYLSRSFSETDIPKVNSVINYILLYSLGLSSPNPAKTAEYIEAVKPAEYPWKKL